MSDADAGRVLFKWADGTEYRSYVRRFDNEGNRIDGLPDTRDFKLRTKRIPFTGSLEADGRIYDRPTRPIRVLVGIAGTLEAREEGMRRTRTKLEARKLRGIARREGMEAESAIHPLVLLRNDVRSGRVPRASAIVTETVRVREGNRNVYDSFQLESLGSLVQLERLAGDYGSRRRVLESVMRTSKGGTQGSPKVSVAGKRTRGTTNLYLTASDLQRASDNAIGEHVSVLTENAKGIQCVRYFRTRGWRTYAAVKRHLREAEENATA